MLTFAATEEPASARGPGLEAVTLLGLAAAPVFGVMACLSAYAAPGMIICSGISAILPINEMALMYLLMGVFHLSPWLKRFSAPATTTEGD